ncbi:MAG: OmpH family outer membrane protein [Bacteroidaceae bacterium]|jgi:outer membrane protein|nr:OmpH family outer membrane protein [Bacteroidaceae bacterium]MBR3618974.1 OmpH family outer membrane protein [Bacteroidaceae bacterium]
MNKTLILIALFSCAGLLSAQEEVPLASANAPQQVVVEPRPFGYLSWNDVLHAMPEYVQAQKSLDELRKTCNGEMERAEQEFSKKFAEYIDGQKSFPENIMLKRQKELQLLMDQSLQFKKEAIEMLQKAEEELMEPLNAKLKEAVIAVGKKRNYSRVFNTDSNALLYIGEDGEDCTDAVLIQLGIK